MEKDESIHAEEDRPTEGACTGEIPAENAARHLAEKLYGLKELPMRVTVLSEALLSLPYDEATELMQSLLTLSATHRSPYREAAFALIKLASIQPPLPYDFISHVYEIAHQRGYGEVVTLLLRPPAKKTADLKKLKQEPQYGALTLGERKSLARRLDSFIIQRIARDPDPKVIHNLLHNPRLTEDVVISIVARRPIPKEILQEVAAHARWNCRVRIQQALARNPYTPTEIALNLLRFLNRRVLKEIAVDHSVHTLVREYAAKLITD